MSITFHSARWSQTRGVWTGLPDPGGDGPMPRRVDVSLGPDGTEP